MTAATVARVKPWWLRLAAYARPHWRGLSVIILFMCSDAAMAAFKPWPMKLIVDHVLIGTSLPSNAAWLTRLPGLHPGDPSFRVNLLVWLAGLTVLVYLVGQITTILRIQFNIVVGQNMVRALRTDIFDQLQHLSIRFHGSHQLGDLMRRVMADSSCVHSLIMNVVLSRIATVVRASVMVTVMWKLNHQLAAIVLLAGLPLGIVSRLFNRRMAARTLIEQRLDGEMTSLAEQTLSVLPVVQSFGREEHGDDRFISLAQRTLEATLRLTVSQLQFQFGTGAIRASFTAGVMLIGGYDALGGSLSVGSLLIFLSYLNSLLGPLENLAYAGLGFASAAAGAQRVFEVIDADDVVRDAPGALPLPVRRKGEGAEVRLEGVVFGYEPDRPVLRGVTMEARAGETVALVGPTGAGKTTLVGLVPRFFDPWEGRVTINGIDVRKVQVKSLRDQIALVLQDSFILPLSIADNIAYGRPEATRAEIEEMARAANASEFIERLPRGYDTVVGERGATLSGGERQRLAIARAFLRDAPLLILDEPTSSLDVGTEALVLGALERLMRGRTVLVIAHRLSTVRRADRIVVLQQGEIAEQGTHDELIANSGKYDEFYNMQYVGVAPIGA